MLSDCFLRQGTVLLPTSGKVDKNVYFTVEPVSMVPVSDTGALRTALHQTIERGNPVVKYDRSAPPILCKYAGVKSWNSFARKASLWTMVETNGMFLIEATSRDARGAFTVEKDAIESLAAGSTVDDLIERMIAILQEAAAKQAG